MKHPMRKALTAVLAMAMPVCGGLMPGVQTAEAAQGRSSSSIYDSYITSIPLSDAAKHMAEAPVGGSTALIPAVSGKTVPPRISPAAQKAGGLLRQAVGRTIFRT